MSSTRHAEHWVEILTALGYLPVAQPAHHVDLDTGISAAMGGSALGLPIIWPNRKKPVSGRFDCIGFTSFQLDEVEVFVFGNSSGCDQIRELIRNICLSECAKRANDVSRLA